MRFKSNDNLSNLLIVALVLTCTSISCTRIKQIARGDTQSEKIKKLNYSVPAGYENGEPDPDIDKEASFRIILPDSNQVLLYNADAPPIDLNTLEEKVKNFVRRQPPGRAAVYIAAAVDVDSAAFGRIFDVLQKNEIESIRLLASSRKVGDNDSSYHEGLPDLAGPDRVYELKLQKENEEADRDVKPNPLTLVAALEPGRRTRLNNESFEDEQEMALRLAEVFRQRESNGVFREGSNEVEKTVMFQLNGTKSLSGPGPKYGDIVRVIDAIKGAGASPIYLIGESGVKSSESIPEFVSKPTVSSTKGTPPPVPKTISAGVLNGKAVTLPQPEYPPAARAVKASGTVNVQVTVDEWGEVVAAYAVSGHPLLRASAVAAARKAKFSPTMISGQAVKVTGVIVYNFVQ